MLVLEESRLNQPRGLPAPTHTDGSSSPSVLYAGNNAENRSNQRRCQPPKNRRQQHSGGQQHFPAGNQTHQPPAVSLSLLSAQPYGWVFFPPPGQIRGDTRPNANPWPNSSTNVAATVPSTQYQNTGNVTAPWTWFGPNQATSYLNYFPRCLCRNRHQMNGLWTAALLIMFMPTKDQTTSNLMR